MGDLMKGLFNFGSPEHIDWPFSFPREKEKNDEFAEGLDPVKFLQLSQSGSKKKHSVKKHKRKKKKHVIHINSAPRAEFLLPGWCYGVEDRNSRNQV